VTYLITFACYGCHVRGDESGSVDRRHNLPGSPTLDPDSSRAAAERARMDQPDYKLDEIRRNTILASLQQVCSHRSWHLLAAHVRSTHVRAVVEAEVRPERIMNDFKAYASRCLNRIDCDEPSRKRWARHGSTRWLWKREDISPAIRYVVDEQGQPMAVFVPDEV
jgi:REP element-mobilizing transposase RayT